VAGQHERALEDCMQALVKRFCDDEKIAGHEKDGPAKFANFMGLADEQDENRLREMRDVSELVTYFVGAVEQRTGRKYLPQLAG
jgi:hypothetical protein